MKSKPLLFGMLFLACLSPDWAQDQAQTEITPAAQEAIQKGIKWLIENQNPDGSWGCEKNQPPSFALTSLSTLALLASGSSADRGPYQKPIQRALKWVEENRMKSGFMSMFDSTAMGEVYEHAAGTLLMAHLYGMSRDKGGDNKDPDARLKATLERALKILEDRQNDDGGWGGYGGTRSSEIGVTAMAYMAIRAGYSCGLNRDKADLKKLEAYLKNAINDGRSRIYGTSAYLRVMYGLGKAKEADAALQQLLKMKLGQEHGRMSEWDYMAAHYSVGALIHDEKSEAWKKWYTYVRDFLVKIQQKDGSWIVEYCLHCRVFASSLALLTLQMPGRILPVDQY